MYNTFIDRIKALPLGTGVSLDAALQPSLAQEAELRTLFATDKQNARLSDPYVGLIDVFAAPDEIRVTRARVIQGKEDLSSQYVMPLSEINRRNEGTPCMVADLEGFRKNWAIFTEGSLFQLLDWNNVVAAGGSVLACLSPLDKQHNLSKRAVRTYYHTDVYPTSDVDLFLWGLDPEQAEAKIKQIYEAVRDSVPWDVTCVRSKHTISIHCQYPYRSVQIVLRLYQSPAEILAGFDIDAPCCAYDGSRVWANPRAIVAMMRQCNTVDVTRRSPSYEIRLAKYAKRGYEVYIPTLNRQKIDPTIYERTIVKIKGLARLLVLEKLKDDKMRASFVRERRELRDRPKGGYRMARIRRRKYKGDLKQNNDNLSLEMNNYDVGTLHIPYGPRWDARRIEKLVYQSDLGMNSSFNPKNKGRRLHRHPAFFGTAQEVMEDCCEHCPKPIDKDEEVLQRTENETYICGRIQFIEEDPGRQSMTGSFNPIDEGEWSEHAYILPTASLFQAIVDHDQAAVQRILKAEGGDVNLHRRDHVGRTALHLAILVKATEIAEDLIDAGARITARLADGRAPLHLAAQHGLPTVIKKLMEKSKENQLELDNSKKSNKVPEPEPEPERPSSEDDWSSNDDEDVVISMSEGDDDDGDEGECNDSPEREDEGRKISEKEKEGNKNQPEDLPDDVVDEPDIIDVNLHDWDFGFNAICYAVVHGSLPALEALLAASADPKLPSAPSSSRSYVSTPFHPLTLAIITCDSSECEIAESLIKAGATSTTADSSTRTIFHNLVSWGRTYLVETVLRCDPNIDKVINLPYLQWGFVVFPVVTAIHQRYYATLMVMVAHGARLDLQEIDITKARDAASETTRRSLLGYAEVENYLHLASQPLEAALAQNDDIAQLLISLEAPINFELKSPSQSSSKWTVKDWIEFGLNSLTKQILQQESELSVTVTPQPVASVATGWRAQLRENQREEVSDSVTSPDLTAKEDKLEVSKGAKAYLLEVQEILLRHNAKTWQEIHPSTEPEMEQPKAQTQSGTTAQPSSQIPEQDWVFVYLSKDEYYYCEQPVPQHLTAAYDELYEACCSGNNEKIRQLCLPDPKPNGDGVDADRSPLNISVRYVTRGKYADSGYTPLFAAVATRRWSTAKLILALAAAQYEPDENDEKIEFDMNVIDDDSDTETMDSDNSDITIDQEKVKFVDIATRSSQVRSRIHPSQLLDTPIRIAYSKARSVAIALAVIRNDLESFVQIANLYESLPQPIELPDLIDTILEQDQPQILDEYIRRTGKGINITDAQESTKIGPVPVAVNDKNKIYLGLNVHGKKRTDLAKKSNPNATAGYGSTIEKPLVCRAIGEKASAIISYLASDGPLSAYRHYASVHSDSKAIWFRRLGTDDGGELEKWLPKWLGWSCDGIGESPLAAAIITGRLKMVKLVAELKPQLFLQSLQIKFLDSDPILLAVATSGNPGIVNFLLRNGVSPSQRDGVSGWNVYHYICSSRDGYLLKFLLAKLPRDVNECLLVQKSFSRGNTPLHIAVQIGSAALVSILVNYSRDSLLIRDVDGQTPLHWAVSRAYSDVVGRLLRVMPKEGLVMENGVGNTPIEMASLAQLLACCKNLSKAFSQCPSGTNLSHYSVNSTTERIPVSEFSSYNEELEVMMKDIPQMIDRGTVSEERKLQMKDEIQKWTNKMVEMLSAAEEREEKKRVERETRKAEENAKRGLRPDVDPFPRDTSDINTTFKLIMNARDADDVDFQPRRLIHLLDVQKSVGHSLNKVNPKTADNEYDGPKVELYDFSKWRRSSTRRLADFGDEESVEADGNLDGTFRLLDYFSTTPDP